MISGRRDRRRRALFWAALASAVIHLIVLTLVLSALVRLFVPRGAREIVSQTNAVTIRREVPATPRPAAAHPARSVKREEAAPARQARHELAKQVAAPASPQPLRHLRLPSRIAREEAGFAREVARLNREDDPHAIPTIDPASREPASKTYAFEIPASLKGSDQGNGLITPTQRWHENGEDCYYGRYEFTYPDGAMEYGTIVWPFCYDRRFDPFDQPPHEIPFPLPLPGYKLPPGTQLPPIEKSVYEAWSGTSVP